MINQKAPLSHFTPFEWDIVYSFSPYTPKELIYETIGYKWDRISKTVNEGMNQLVFMNNGEVVCYLYGYPGNNKYGISFSNKEYKDGVAILYADAGDKFVMKKNGDVIYIEQVQ